MSKRFFIVTIAICIAAFSYNLTGKELEVRQLKNNFVELCGSYDSPAHGLFALSKTAILRIDENNGGVSSYPLRWGNGTVEPDDIFEYRGDLYSYNKSVNTLYKMVNGEMVRWRNNVVGHYCDGESLYLLGNEEPAMVKYTGTDSVIYFMMAGNLDIDAYNFVEINNEKYVFVSSGPVGKFFVAKIRKDSLEFLMSPYLPGYEEFREIWPRSMDVQNNELWIKSFRNVYKLEDSLVIDYTNVYNKKDDRIFDQYIVDNIVYGLSDNGIFVTDTNSMEMTYLYEEEYTTDYPIPKTWMQRFGNKFYIAYMHKLFCYDMTKKTFEEIELRNDAEFESFSVLSDGKYIITYNNCIEIFNGVDKMYLGLSGLSGNNVRDLCIDPNSGHLAIIATSGNYPYLQYYDGSFYDSEKLQFDTESFALGETNQMDVVIAYNGYKYVSLYKNLWIYDGTDWAMDSKLTFPKDSGFTQLEEYHVLLQDSTGGVWVSAYLHEYNSDKTTELKRYALYRYTMQNCDMIMETDTVLSFLYGQCLPNGEIYIQTLDDRIYKFANGTGEFINPQPCSDDGNPNGPFEMFCNYAGELQLRFNGGMLFVPKEQKQYVLTACVQRYNGSEWLDYPNAEIVEKRDFNLTNSYFFYDELGNEYLVNKEQLLRISPMGVYDIWDLKGFTQSIINSHILWNGKVMLATKENGIFIIDLPNYNPVEENRIEDRECLLPEVITTNTVACSDMLLSCKVYSLEGIPMMVDNAMSGALNTSSLRNGVYFAVCQTSEGQKVQKFMIAR